MTAPAVVMMVVTILIVWGGLVVSIMALRFLPTPDEQGVRNGFRNGRRNGNGKMSSQPQQQAPQENQ